jgi:hypothetical protein
MPVICPAGSKAVSSQASSDVKPTAEDPVTLVFDGHFSHVCNLKVINSDWKNYVTTTSLPPHT